MELTFEDAVQAVLTHEQDSEEWREAMGYVIMNAPPPLKQMFDDAFRRCFPDLKPDHYDDEGNPYYDVEKTRKYFGVSREDVEELVERHPESIVHKKMLHKAQ